MIRPRINVNRPFAIRSTVGYLREVSIIASAYFAYMFVRKVIIPDVESIAFENAVKLASFESAWGFFWEPNWQGWAIEHSRALVILLIWFYILTFWPVIIITAHALYFADRAKYFRARNVVLLTFLLALICFAVFPLAPPFFLSEYGFIDNIRQFGPVEYTSVLYTDDNEAAVFYNAFAAMPSVHFAFTVLFGIVFFSTRHKWLKPLAIIYPSSTFVAIVVTGNHFIIEAVGGIAVLLAAFLTAQLLRRRRRLMDIAKSRIVSGLQPLRWAPKHKTASLDPERSSHKNPGGPAVVTSFSPQRPHNHSCRRMIAPSVRQITTWNLRPGSLEYPLVIAHRGGGGLAAENTLTAFRNVVDIGADGVELDARLSRDGEVVIIHDRRLDRTTNGGGHVWAYTLKELKRLDAGSWFGPQFNGERIPTLEEVFDALPKQLLVHVDLKARGPKGLPLAVKVAQIIRRHSRWESTLVGSFNPIATMGLRSVAPQVLRGYTWSCKHPLPLCARWFSPLVRPHWLTPDRDTFTVESLEGFHRQGKLVLAWALDAGSDMEQLKEIRLDAVVTDRPDVLVRQGTKVYR